MSDENPPKLRLRPKLAGAPPAVPFTPPPPSPPPPDEGPPGPTRAKLSLKPDLPTPVQSAASPENEAINFNDPAPSSGRSSDPRTFSPPTPPKPLLVPRKTVVATPPAEMTPADSGATPPFPTETSGEKKLPAVLNAPPPPRIKVSIPTAETWPAVLDAPPPPGLSPVPSLSSGTEGEPAEITAIRKASTFPFPSPTVKFPALPGLAATGSESPEPVAPESFLKKLLVIGALVFLVLAAGGAFAYFKFFAKPKIVAQPVEPPAPVAAQPQPAPTPPKSKVLQMIDKVQQEQLAPLNEVVSADNSSTQPKPAASTPVVESPAASSVTPAPDVAIPPPVPVKPPPPAPSLAFKAWVINLKIRGVRGGDAQRVFIDKISYVPGDVVNQQLGIMFIGYDESTRMLSFQDKTGATFERRH